MNSPTCVKRGACKFLLHFALLSILCGLIACSRNVGEREPAAGITRSQSEEILATLRERSAATGSFRCRGTMLLEWETERHFIHFAAHFARPANLRLDLDGGGPLGIGSGRLTWVERPDSVELLLPGESEPIRRGAGADMSDLIDTHGLLTRDAAYMIAPYAGDPALFRPSNLVASGVESRTGNYRLVLKRADSLREVIFVEPEGLHLVARRVAKPDGTVLLVSLYEYGGRPEGGAGAESVENTIPVEGSSIKVRFSQCEWNVPIEETIFQWSTKVH